MKNICKNCDFLLFDECVINGDILCTNCGLVQDIYIDTKAEWRNYENDTSNGKVRCEEYNVNGINGMNGITLGGNDRRLQRIHMWNFSTTSDRHLYQIYEEFEKFNSMNLLSKEIVNHATSLYKQLYKEMEDNNYGIKRSSIRSGLKAACFYFACKKLNYPREKKEIAMIMGYSAKTVTKGCNIFLDIMGEDYIKMEPFKATDFIYRYSNLLEISFKHQSLLFKLIEFISVKEPFVDNTPSNITSAGIYFLTMQCNLGITKQMIFNKCGTSKIILGKLYLNILNYKTEILELFF